MITYKQFNRLSVEIDTLSKVKKASGKIKVASARLQAWSTKEIEILKNSLESITTDFPKPDTFNMGEKGEFIDGDLQDFKDWADTIAEKQKEIFEVEVEVPKIAMDIDEVSELEDVSGDMLASLMELGIFPEDTE